MIWALALALVAGVAFHVALWWPGDPGWSAPVMFGASVLAAPGLWWIFGVCGPACNPPSNLEEP